MLLAAPGAAPADDAPAANDVEIIAGREDSHDRMTVPVRIGENGPYHFLVDTGSQGTVISTELAARLALAPISQRRVIGIAGTLIAGTTMLDEFSFGRDTQYDMMVVLFERRHIGVDGIVGIDSLQDQRVLIDFTANSIAVGDARSQGGNAGFEIVVTARRRAGQLVVTSAEIDGIRTAVVIDTGAETSIGNRALQRALGQRDLPPSVLISVTGQEAPADIGFAREIAIGKVGIVNAVIAFTDGPAFAALGLDRKPALMLGMRELRLFRRVAIDFSKRKVFFDLPEEL